MADDVEAKDPSHLDQHRIASLILAIRGQRVILDSDLAALYGVANKALIQAVKRNIVRFSGGFHVSA